MTRRRGFTLVELLVVIAVIGILVGLLLTALGLMRRGQRRAVTQQLMTQLGVAVDLYLEIYPQLGDGSDASAAAFSADPLKFLVRRPLAMRRAPFIELKQAQQVAGTPAQPATQASAERVRDGFGGELTWVIANGPAGGPYTFTESVTLHSTAGTAATRDDLVYRFTRGEGRWSWPAP